MTTITITIDDASVDRVQAAFAAKYGYSDTVAADGGTTIPNPESLADFTARKVRESVLQVVKDVECFTASNDAFTAKAAEIDAAGMVS